MSNFRMMVGIPGVGKSTIVKGLQGSLISTDAFIDDMASKLNMTYDELFQREIKNATRSMKARFKSCIKERKDMVHDQTNLSVSKRKSFLDQLPKGYWKVCYEIISPNSDEDIAEWHRRLANRPGKTIPMSVLEDMRRNKVPPTLEEGFDTIIRYDMYGNWILRHDKY